MNPIYIDTCLHRCLQKCWQR